MNRLNPVRINYINFSQETTGDGLSNVFNSMFNSAAKTIASEISKKIIKSAAETATKAAIEPVAKKTGQVIAANIFKTTEEAPDKNEEEMPIKCDKGPVIEKDLKKVYKDKINDKNDNKIDNKTNNKEYIKKVDELL